MGSFQLPKKVVVIVDRETKIKYQFMRFLLSVEYPILPSFWPFVKPRTDPYEMIVDTSEGLFYRDSDYIEYVFQRKGINVLRGPNSDPNHPQGLQPHIQPPVWELLPTVVQFLGKINLPKPLPL